MGADDRIHVGLGLEAERQRALRVEVARPAGDDLDDDRIGLAADRATPPCPRRPCRAPRSSRRPSPTGPGMVRLRRAPIDEVSSPAACSRKCTAARGLATQWRTSSDDRQDRLLARRAAPAGCPRRSRTPPCWACPGARRWSEGGCRCRRGSRAANSRRGEARRSPFACRRRSAAYGRTRRRSCPGNGAPNTAIDEVKTSFGL